MLLALLRHAICLEDASTPFRSYDVTSDASATTRFNGLEKVVEARRGKKFTTAGMVSSDVFFSSQASYLLQGRVN